MSVRVERADRVKAIRAAMGLTQPEFAERLNAVAAALKLDVRYSQLSVSQRETGRLALDIEDYAVLSYADPERRSANWLAFGRELPKPLPNLRPMPQPSRVAEAPVLSAASVARKRKRGGGQ